MEQNLTFADLGLSEEILQALEKKGYGYPTRIQAEAIPEFMQWKDVIAKAPTGTGKTFAFGIPMIEHIDAESEDLQGLILAPTRELAIQICDELRGLLTYYKNIRVAVVYGGAKIEGQIKQLKNHPQIVVATPGRLMDHYKRHTLSFDKVQTVVLDEADRMLDMGFFDDIMKIIKELPTERQTIMFSATLPPKIRQMAKQILRNPAEVNIAVSKPNEAIQQGIYVCYENQKMEIVRALFGEPTGTKTIIFSSSKQKVKELAYTLKRMKLNAAAMHSDLEQEQREEVMLDFKNGKIDLLVATDIVARGIDIEDIGTVVNYDVPHDPEDYIHRIGRTARASATGRAITFVSEKEQGKFHRIETFMERDVEKLPIPEHLGKGPVYNPDESDRRFSGRGGHGRGGNRRDGQSGAGGRGGRNGRNRSGRKNPEQGAQAQSSAQAPQNQGATPEGTQPQGAKERTDGQKNRRNNRRRFRGPKGPQGSPGPKPGDN